MCITMCYRRYNQRNNNGTNTEEPGEQLPAAQDV